MAITDEVTENLAHFDALDFEAFNKQNWELFYELHSEDVVVTLANGRKIRGLDRHDEALRAMLAWAPDLQISRHPVTFGSGEWTAGIGTLEGTFTQPMRMPGGKIVPPSGRHFAVPMASIVRWDNGKVAEENRFWDMQAVQQQLGIIP